MRLSIAVSILAALLLNAGINCRVWGHGISLAIQYNAGNSPVSVTATSDQPFLDQDGTLPSAGSPMNSTLFLDQFQLTGTDVRGNYQLTPEGGGYFESPNLLPAGTTTTIKFVTPLYYADGNGTAAKLATGTTNIYFSDNNDSNPTTSGLHATLSGSSVPPVAGFQQIVANGNSPENGHEIVKQLYIDPASTQTAGEYGFGFTLTMHLPSGQSITTGTLTDIFALTDPTGTNTAVESFLASDSRQDLATTQIFNAINTSPVPEPSTFVLAALGVFWIPWRRFRKRRGKLR